MYLFVDNLTNVDFSYLHPQRGLVGETWLASVVLEGALDEQGMVCDFGIVKKTLRQWLDDTIDHCLLVPQLSPQLSCNKQETLLQAEWFFNGDHRIQCSSPHGAITLIETDAINPESVAAWCIEQLRSLLPDSIDRIQLRFEPEVIDSDFYHYSHGLKKHNGNCQRIAHGHRSRIEIYRDNQRDTALERLWCEQWRDIYIGTWEDLADTYQSNQAKYYQFRYRSYQGEFELSLPADCCYLIDTDSTVEFIAQHIADSLKNTHPNHQFHVKAFEGLAKGAIAFSE